MYQLSEVYWRCRRGMLELDLFLISFFEAQFEQLSEIEKKQFVVLLEKPDPDLLNLLMGYAIPDEAEFKIVNKIRFFKQKQEI